MVANAMLWFVIMTSDRSYIICEVNTKHLFCKRRSMLPFKRPNQEQLSGPNLIYIHSKKIPFKNSWFNLILVKCIINCLHSDMLIHFQWKCKKISQFSCFSWGLPWWQSWPLCSFPDHTGQAHGQCRTPWSLRRARQRRMCWMYWPRQSLPSGSCWHTLPCRDFRRKLQQPVHKSFCKWENHE